MSLAELFVLAVGLSMDAFAVSVCKGLCIGKTTWRHCLTAGLWFGAFQAGMPALGYLLGSRFAEAISAYDHWIAFVLLLLIGLNMIREACGDGEGQTNASMSFAVMLPLAVATSIDALAVGLMFSFLRVQLLFSLLMIGCTTFVLSAVGIRLGSAVGDRFRRGAGIVGGCILIFIGLHILLEHLGVL